MMPSALPRRAAAMTGTSSLASSFLRLRVSPPTQPHVSSPSASRSFSCTALRQAKTVWPHRLPSKLIPPYPYGDRLLYKQSNKGLYGTARIRFGNIVSDRNKIKTRRFWRPNVHVKHFRLKVLDARVKVRLTLRVLKTILREGSIENYILKDKPQRIKDLGPGGWRLRWLLMQTRAVQEQMNAQRLELGLEPKPIVDNDAVIQYALDYATPGKLSLRSRATLEELKLQEALDDAFVLGGGMEFDDMDVEEDVLESVESLEAEMAAQEAGQPHNTKQN